MYLNSASLWLAALVRPGCLTARHGEQLEADAGTEQVWKQRPALWKQAACPRMQRHAGGQMRDLNVNGSWAVSH